MRVRVKSEKVNLWIPIPVQVAGMVLRLIPEKAFEDMGKDVPEPYKVLVSKAMILFVWSEVQNELKECKGLEIVRVRAHDGTYISIKI